MANPHSADKSQPARTKSAAKPKGAKADPPVEQDPAVERGERLQTGKTIARSGDDEGFVPGATEQPPSRATKDQ